MDKYIDRFGYHISKKLLSEKDYINIKTELTVKPIVNTDYALDAEAYELYKETDDFITIPQHYMQKTKVQYIGKVNPINIKFKGVLRDYQLIIVEECIKKIKADNGGIISIPCGGGKTVLALYIATLLKVKTLVVTHKSFLLNQWTERVTEFIPDAKIGIIRQNKVIVEGKDIVIGMLQSIAMKDYDDKIFEGFGLVIFDECHHTPSRIFSNCLSKTSFKYTIGLSATPVRADGLTKVMHWYLGNLIYKMEKKQDNNVYVKAFDYVSTDPLFVEKTSWFQGKRKASVPIMVTNMYKINSRNIFISNIINNLIGQKGRKILVLSHRLEHLEILKNMCDASIKIKVDNKELEDNEIITSKYIGGMKEAAQVIAGAADVIFASYALAEEGLDIDGLNTLILATPKTNIIQSIGRIMRKPIKSGDIFPMIVDIIDNFSVFSRWGAKRLEYYNNQKYKVNNYKALNDKCISIKDYLINKNVIKNDIEDEDLCFEYVCHVEDKYAYSAKVQNNTLDTFWKNTNYNPDLNSIFNIEYEWEITNYKKVAIKKPKKVLTDDILTHRIKK